MFKRSVKCGILLTTLCAATTQADLAIKPAHRYSVVQLATPEIAACEPGFTQRTYTRRMNDAGQIVGYHECWGQSGIPEAPILMGPTRGYVSSPEQGARVLDPVRDASAPTMARGINESGLVVGREMGDDGFSALIWFPWGGADLVVPWRPCGSYPVATAEDINDHGAIALRAPRAGCANWVLRLGGEEFVGPVGTPAALNNNDVMVGSSGFNAMKWSPAIGEVILGPPRTTRYETAYAHNINDGDVAVGQVTRLDELGQCVTTADAVRWSKKGIERVLKRLPGDTEAIALGINEGSLIVGRSSSAPACNAYDPELNRAVIWRNKNPKDLNELLKREDAHKIHLIGASAINSTGQIAAYGFYRDEPLTKCWDYGYDEETGEEYYDTTLMCRNTYAFLLTPLQ